MRRGRERRKSRSIGRPRGISRSRRMLELKANTHRTITSAPHPRPRPRPRRPAAAAAVAVVATARMRMASMCPATAWLQRGAWLRSSIRNSSLTFTVARTHPSRGRRRRRRDRDHILGHTRPRYRHRALHVTAHHTRTRPRNLVSTSLPSASDHFICFLCFAHSRTLSVCPYYIIALSS